MRKLFFIPARGGSKGLPRKNILPLAGRPMIEYTLDAALGSMDESDEICVSTDDLEIAEVVENYGVKVNFVRPVELASDTTSTEEVIEHAIQWYEKRKIKFDLIILLQVTSPLRNAQNVKEALLLWESSFDMVVSVKKTDANPYYVLREENPEGFLIPSKKGKFLRRQDVPEVWELNGAIYIINSERIQQMAIIDFQKVKKYVMSKETSIDIDDELDFFVAEKILKG